MTGPIQGTLFSNKDRTIMLKKIFKPSQWINLGYVIFGIGASPFTMGITLIIPAWKMLETYCTSYEFHQDRIIYRRGVLSVTTDEILIHRIKSINLHEPFLYRLVGISNLRVISHRPKPPATPASVETSTKLPPEVVTDTEYEQP